MIKYASFATLTSAGPAFAHHTASAETTSPSHLVIACALLAAAMAIGKAGRKPNPRPQPTLR